MLFGRSHPGHRDERGDTSTDQDTVPEDHLDIRKGNCPFRCRIGHNQANVEAETIWKQEGVTEIALDRLVRRIQSNRIRW
jgi:hypothetical protein